MKILRGLFALLLAADLSGVAKADTFVPGDFAAVVIDPIPANGVVISSTTFTVTIFPCQADQLDGLSTSAFVGCFTGLNNSGTALTSLSMGFPAIYLGQTLDIANCPTEPQNIFTLISCGFTDSTHTEYVLNFSGGNIPTFGSGPDCPVLTPCEQDSIFTIGLGGIPYNSLPQSFTAVGNTVAPEPGSLLLESSGVMSIGLFAAFRRREILAATRR